MHLGRFGTIWGDIGRSGEDLTVVKGWSEETMIGLGRFGKVKPRQHLALG
jgi:hypothetical protein